MIIINKTRCEKGKVGEKGRVICMGVSRVLYCTNLKSVAEEGPPPFFFFFGGRGGGKGKKN